MLKAEFPLGTIVIAIPDGITLKLLPDLFGGGWTTGEDGFRAQHFRFTNGSLEFTVRVVELDNGLAIDVPPSLIRQHTARDGDVVTIRFAKAS